MRQTWALWGSKEGMKMEFAHGPFPIKGQSPIDFHSLHIFLSPIFPTY